MENKYLYSLLFAVPGFFVALTISFIIFGAGAGFLWIYIFGDNPVSSSLSSLIGVLAVVFIIIIFLIFWIIFIAIGFSVGKKIGNDKILKRRHILFSGIVTLLFILFIVFNFDIVRLAPKSDSDLCSDMCKGYSTSSLSPKNSGQRTCSCLDNSGKTVISAPLKRSAK